MWESETRRNFVHAPFLNKQCLSCHSARASASPSSQGALGSADGAVQWLEKFNEAATSHWIAFKTAKRNPTLLLEVDDNQLNRLSREIPLAPLAALPEPPTSTTPPQISDVRIGNVSSGVLSSVMLTWKTDRPTNAVVYYGGKEMNLTADDSYHFTSDHAITITCAKQCLNFKYMVVSEDISGLKTGSDIYPLGLPGVAEGEVAPEQNGGPAPEPGALAIEPTLFRRGDRYLINVKADRPVLVALGIRSSSDGEAPARDGGKKILRHFITADESYTNTGSCIKCHGKPKMAFAHPVNVFPKQGMNISLEYPLLADGRLTCTTCHAPHASDARFRIVQDPEQKLCIACHPERMTPVNPAK
jgi:predicted CXXCH cytochrome family protein